VKVATRKKFEIGNFKLAFTDAKSRGHIPHRTPPTDQHRIVTAHT
jgi:hypothetical protein